MAEYTALYKEALAGLKSGGKKLEADLADIEAGKKSAIAGGIQNLISGGLGGTTVTGAVPLAAEKTASRARLGARGAAENRYWSALMSFAGLAEGSRQAELDRTSREKIVEFQARQRSREMLFSQPTGGGRTYGAGSFPDMFSIPGERPMGTDPAQQFPTLYGDTGTLPSAPSLTGGTGGYSAPREYDPSMVGKSLWAQQGSQIPTTLETGTKQAVTASLPQSAQPSTGKMFTSVLEAQKAGPGSKVNKAGTIYEITSTGAARRIGYA